MTQKQKKFCAEYLLDLDSTQAAVRAGYSPQSAGLAGRKNLENPKIQNYISYLMSQKDDSLIAKQEEVLKSLTRIMRREEDDTKVVTEKKRRTYYDENGKKVTDNTDEPIKISVPTKVSDANKAALMLGRYYSLFTDNMNIKNDTDFKISIDYGDGGTDS